MEDRISPADLAAIVALHDEQERLALAADVATAEAKLAEARRVQLHALIVSRYALKGGDGYDDTGKITRAGGK